MPAPLLQVHNLTTRFNTERGPVTAVDDVSLDVNAGETVAIVGESGSGKSVTALSIMRLIPSPPGRIEAGSVMFEGKDLLKLSDAAIRDIRGNRIAMIFQEPMSSLNPALTVGLRSPSRSGCIAALHGRARSTWPRSCSRGCAFPTRQAGSPPIRTSTRAECASA
jgi:ABC-type microcin C transport system duplicated ATPase subunit YejF